ncbi:Hypothetical Protein FCC1311_103292 [Hondaea fermentalgiana]|uniref:Uncharacterized protein n=1 Tax=Hondaea fermentalgiana TaxID=2315210 RepID=A0A2R5GTB0_9STRA|nr:Hypothetical Protein FCC1311_103292 [Hondaea fermentalgiana]|eukprot:GBG34106.1 Hypothetical Protein FCC1311_103292 [Hondaea fermentalgiana]
MDPNLESAENRNLSEEMESYESNLFDSSAQCGEEAATMGNDSIASSHVNATASVPPEDAPAPPSMKNDEKATAPLMGSAGALYFEIIQTPPNTICKENAQLAEFAIVLKFPGMTQPNKLRLVVTEKKAQSGVRQEITFDRRAGSRSYQMTFKMKCETKSEMKSSEVPFISDGECIVRDRDQLALVWLKANRKSCVGTYDLQFFDGERAASEAMEVEIKSKPNVKYGKAFGRNGPPSKKDNEKIIKTVQDKYVQELYALKDSFINEHRPQVPYFDPSILGDIFDRNKSMYRLTPSISSESSTTSRVSHSLNQLQLSPKRAREDEEHTAEGVFKKFKALAPTESTLFEKMFYMHMGKSNTTPGSNANLNRSVKRNPRRGRAMCLEIIQAPPMIICKENAQLAEFAIVLKYSNVSSLKTLRLVVTERETQLGIWQDITFCRRAQSKSFQMRSKMNSRIKSEIESPATPVISDGECIVREQDQLALVWLKANRKNRVGTYSLQFFDEEIPASEALEIEIKSKPNVKYGKAFGGNKPPSKKDNEKIFKTVQDKYVHELCALKNSFNNENCPQVSYFDPSPLGDIFDRNKSMHRLTPSIRSEPSTTSRVSHSLNQLQLFPKRAREDEDQTAEGVFKKFKALVPAERTRFEEMFSAHMGKCNATPGSNAILNRSAKRKPRRGPPPSMENDEKATALLMGSSGAKSFVIKQVPPKTICKENAQLAEFAIVLKYSNTLPLNNLRLAVTGKKAQFGVRQVITFDRRPGSRSFQVNTYETPIVGEAECIVRDQDQLVLVLLKANRKNRVGTYDLQFFDEKRVASEAMEVEIKSKPNAKYGKAISRNEPLSRIDNEKIIKTVQDKYVRDLRALKDSFINENCPEVSCFDPSILGDIFDRNKSMNRLTPSIKSEPSATSRVSHSLNQLQLFPKRAREDEDQTAEGVFKKFKALAPAERTRFEEMFNTHMAKCYTMPGSSAKQGRGAKRNPRRGRK